MAHTLDPDRLKDVFEAISQNIEKLSKWEQDFFESVSDQFDRGKTLSEKQLEVIEKIYLKLP